MSSYQNSLMATSNGHSGATSPSLMGIGSSGTLMNNGLTSSPNMSSSSSPIASRQSLSSQPEQIIVPVGNVMSGGKFSDSGNLSQRQPSTPSHSVSTGSLASRQSSTPSQAASANSLASLGTDSRGVLDKMRLRDLVKEVDPMEQMDDDVEDILLQVADEFIENVVASSCQLAKHRRSNTLEAKDVQLYLERCWNMQIPGFGGEEFRPYKKSVTTEAHKQRLALIRKTLKKY